MEEREIRIYSILSGRHQCSYGIEGLGEALEDIEHNGMTAVGIQFDMSGNVIILVSDNPYPEEGE